VLYRGARPLRPSSYSGFARQSRSIYWHVPLKENDTEPGTQQPHNLDVTRNGRMQPTSTPARIANQRPAEATNSRVSANNISSNLPTPQRAEPSIESRTSAEALETRTSVSPLTVEDWAAPVTHEEPEQQADPTIELTDPRIMATYNSLSSVGAENRRPQLQSRAPVDNTLYDNLSVTYLARIVKDTESVLFNLPGHALSAHHKTRQTGLPAFESPQLSY
jgi:hypothetical protein